VDLLDLATLLRLYVVNNLPLAFALFDSFSMFVAFGMLPSVAICDAARCDVAS